MFSKRIEVRFVFFSCFFLFSLVSSSRVEVSLDNTTVRRGRERYRALSSEIWSETRRASGGDCLHEFTAVASAHEAEGRQFPH